MALLGRDITVPDAYIYNTKETYTVGDARPKWDYNRRFKRPSVNVIAEGSYFQTLWNPTFLKYGICIGLRPTLPHL